VVENISTSGTEQFFQVVEEIKRFGCKLAIDDFGTKYSNFSRILALEPHFIKIDGSLIQNLVTKGKSRQTTAAITNFAHSMQAQVIAEFVSSTEIQEIVEDLQIDYSQGYLFSKPAAAARVPVRTV